MDLHELLLEHGHVVEWCDLDRHLSRHAIDSAVRHGLIERVFPRVYVCASHVDDPEVMRRAAARYVGEFGALSHTTGCLAHGLDIEQEAPHVSVGRQVRLRGNARLVVHRRVDLPSATRRQGVRVLALEQCLVDSWRILDEERRRALVIHALRERRTTPSRLRRCADRSRASGRNGLVRLIELVAVGCHSELEIYGLLDVFDVAELRHLVRQLPVRVGHAVFWLDLAEPATRTAFELDGLQHADARRREADLRRDAALAAAGWLTLRFTYERLHRHAEEVRGECVAILASRRTSGAG